MNCPNCGATIAPSTNRCVKCGSYVEQPAAQPAAQQPAQQAGAAPAAVGTPTKSKLAAGLLGVFVGWLGVHRFYLGYTGIGVAQLLLSVLGVFTCGITTTAAWIWGLIDGILILVGTIDRDAQGRPLKE